MVAPLMARLLLVVFVAPFFLLTIASVFALVASQAGEFAGSFAASAVLVGMTLGLKSWVEGLGTMMQPEPEA